MSAHTVHIKLEDESWPQLTIECTDRATCGPVYNERGEGWPDEFTCHCVDPDCACREGDHDACGGDTVFVDDMGPSCRLDADSDSCWFQHAIEECGFEMIHMPEPLTFTIQADLRGAGWDNPIELRVKP